MTSSALAICTSAARSTSRVMDAHMKRRGVPLPIHLVRAHYALRISFQLILFSSSLRLLELR
jgi:hypothetical protein